MNPIKLLLIYMLIANIVTLAAYAADKWQAQHSGWRIPERILIWLSALGGGIGALVGIWGLRHKTKHALFTVGVPAIMFAEFILVNAVIYMICSR